MDVSEIYMQRALELAERGRQMVSPNPMVGCVIVHDGSVIGEGYHKKYGDAHAEVNAIKSVKNRGLLKEATLYVTLEPCAHFGKTPPCAQLIIETGIPRVVICNVDPNPLVSGKGIALLRNAGVQVVENVLKEAGWKLNVRFFTFHMQQRPYVILKWAQTADGFIARGNYDSKWISDEYSRMLSHKWRSEEDAIMVGKNTVLHDNPSLTNRGWSGYSPSRIVIDKALEVSKDAYVLDQSQTTLCYNAIEERSEEYNQYIQLDFSSDIIPQIIQDLYARKIQSVIVEGGSILLTSFLKHNLWDEARVFVSKSMVFQTGIAAPTILQKAPVAKYELFKDILWLYQNTPN